MPFRAFKKAYRKMVLTQLLDKLTYTKFNEEVLIDCVEQIDVSLFGTDNKFIPNEHVRLLHYTTLRQMTLALTALVQNGADNTEVVSCDKLTLDVPAFHPVNSPVPIEVQDFFFSDGEYYIDGLVNVADFKTAVIAFLNLMTLWRAYDVGFERYNYNAQLSVYYPLVSVLKFIMEFQRKNL